MALYKNGYKQAGNVIFLVLVAVVLFAALAFAVTSGTRVSDSAGQDRSRLTASEILNFAANVEQGVTRAKVSRTCGDTEIRFQHDGLPSEYENATGTPADKSCYVFEAVGGRAVYQEPPIRAIDARYSAQPDYGRYTFSGSNSIEGLRPVGRAQLVFFLPYMLEDICKQLNYIQNINPPLGTPVVDSNGIKAVTSDNYFSGTYTNGAQIDAGGLKSGCLQVSDIGNGAGSDPYFVFFYVISQR